MLGNIYLSVKKAHNTEGITVEEQENRREVIIKYLIFILI